MDGYSGNWTPQDNKLFENALATVPEDAPDRWERIAVIAGKSPAEVWQHFEKLLHDVSEIEAGRIELPNYSDGSAAPNWGSDHQGSGTPDGSKGKAGEGERRMGVPWTEEEHRDLEEAQPSGQQRAEVLQLTQLGLEGQEEVKDP